MAREVRQGDRIRREMERMQELLHRTGSQMTDSEKEMEEYHALDLRDISYAVRDLIVAADTAVPDLAPLLDADGPEDMEAPEMPQLNPNALVFVSSIVPVFRVLRNLSLMLDNKVQYQARFAGIGAYVC